MTHLLLDTNALIWLLTDDPRLGGESRERIGAGDPVYFSSVSVLETTMKTMLGRLSLPDDPGAAAPVAGLQELPFSAVHATGLNGFPDLVRHDPFDRMLLAQANVERLDLLTADRALLSLGYPWVLDART